MAERVGFELKFQAINKSLFFEIIPFCDTSEGSPSTLLPENLRSQAQLGFDHLSNPR